MPKPSKMRSRFLRSFPNLLASMAVFKFDRG